MTNHHPFFQDKNCPYFPCHQTAEPENFNCFLCYCPLYALGENCGGDFCYTNSGIKDCSCCLLPHQPELTDSLKAKLNDVVNIARKASEVK